MVRLFARFRRPPKPRPRAIRRSIARPNVESLEGRTLPATWIAPDLLAASDTGASSMDNITAVQTPRFAGATTSPAGTSISLMVDGVANGSYVVPLSGGSIFSIRPTTPLADGSHTIQFRDSHTHKLSASLTITVDAAAPNSAADLALDASIGSGTTSATALIFNGTGEPGATATLFLDGNLQATTTIGGDGTYRFVVDPVSLGRSRRVRHVLDLAGNTSLPSNPVDVTVVGPTPTASGFVLSPTDVSPNGDGVQDAPTADFTLSAPATVTLTLYDAADNLLATDPLGDLPAGPATAALDVSGLPDGVYHVFLNVVGDDGSAASPVRTDFTIDTVAPNLLGPVFGCWQRRPFRRQRQLHVADAARFHRSDRSRCRDHGRGRRNRRRHCNGRHRGTLDRIRDARRGNASGHGPRDRPRRQYHEQPAAADHRRHDGSDRRRRRRSDRD